MIGDVRILEDGTIRKVVWCGGELLPGREQMSQRFEMPDVSGAAVYKATLPSESKQGVVTKGSSVKQKDLVGKRIAKRRFNFGRGY